MTTYNNSTFPKHVILVYSGKGGVGKSTVAANLAYTLAAMNNKVAVFDADIYGPSQFILHGIRAHTDITDNNPVISSNGIEVMSIAKDITEKQAVDWRGPMATVAIKNMLFNTNWTSDYLVIDLPPGTGDIQMTLAECVPDAVSVIVTTPQQVALADCIKGIELFINKGIKIAGIVENMSGFVCSHCDHITDIFSKGGAAALTNDYNVKLLGKIPIDDYICSASDRGILATKTSTKLLNIYTDIAEGVINEFS